MIKIRCNSDYHESPRTLASFEGDNAQENAMAWVEDLLLSVARKSLMSALNDIQCKCNEGHNPDGPQIFPNKYTMPLCIINLVLKEHRIWLEED